MEKIFKVEAIIKVNYQNDNDYDNELKNNFNDTLNDLLN